MEKQQKYVSGSNLKEVIDSQDWEDIWLKLQAHTLYILRNRYGVFEKSRLVDLSRNLISEALEKVFLEERKWYPSSKPDFYDFLTSVIDSHINNYWRNKERLRTIRTGDERYLEKNAPISPAEQDNSELSEFRNKIYLALVETGADDEELIAFDCMADGVIKPSDIQKELGISEAHRNNILRRLRRRLEKIRTKIYKQ